MGRSGKKVPGTAEELEQFEQFLFEMVDVLDTLISEALEGGVQLDFSIESLHWLEEYLLAGTSLDQEQLALRKSRAARYLGEVFRRCVGGHWELCLKGPRYLYNKLPVIAGYTAEPVEFCPTEIVANYFHSREQGFLARVVESDKLVGSDPLAAGWYED